jgi:hypothetical protein
MNKLIASLIVGAFSLSALAGTAPAPTVTTTPAKAEVKAEPKAMHKQVKEKTATKKVEAAK